mmetsp:Transcript_12377/g.19596  ORF Transcript_12377/g.19596 Transcript_12377/m.19596 type:complete len:189 (+) Transcript_12377:120-686(+)
MGAGIIPICGLAAATAGARKGPARLGDAICAHRGGGRGHHRTHQVRHSGPKKARQPAINTRRATGGCVPHTLALEARSGIHIRGETQRTPAQAANQGKALTATPRAWDEAPRGRGDTPLSRSQSGRSMATRAESLLAAPCFLGRRRQASWGPTRTQIDMDTSTTWTYMKKVSDTYIDMYMQICTCTRP